MTCIVPPGLNSLFCKWPGDRIAFRVELKALDEWAAGKRSIEAYGRLFSLRQADGDWPVS